MPGIKYQDDHAEEADPVYSNLTELCKKTGTKTEDWKPIRMDIEAWLKTQPFKDFKTKEASQAEDAFILVLGRKYHSYMDRLFSGLNENGIQGTISYLIRRTASNVRRRTGQKPEEGSPKNEWSQSSSDEVPQQMRNSNLDVSDHYTMASPRVQDRGGRPKSIPTIDLAKENIRVKYGTSVSRLTLSDIGKAAQPPLSREETLDEITMPTVIKCVCEDLDLDSTTLELWYIFSGGTELMKLRSDRQLRSAISEIVTGESQESTLHVQQTDQSPLVSPGARPGEVMESIEGGGNIKAEPGVETLKRGRQDQSGFSSQPKRTRRGSKSPTPGFQRSLALHQPSHQSSLPPHHSGPRSLLSIPDNNSINDSLDSDAHMEGIIHHSNPEQNTREGDGSLVPQLPRAPQADTGNTESLDVAIADPKRQDDSLAHGFHEDNSIQGDLSMEEGNIDQGGATDLQQEEQGQETPLAEIPPTTPLESPSTPAPAGERTLAPATLRTPAPVGEKTPAPAGQKTSGPVKERTSALAKEKTSGTPNKKTAPSAPTQTTSEGGAGRPKQVQSYEAIDLTVDGEEVPAKSSAQVGGESKAAAKSGFTGEDKDRVAWLNQGFRKAEVAYAEKTRKRKAQQEATREAGQNDDAVEEMAFKEDKTVSTEEKAKNVLKNLWPAAVTEHVSGRNERWTDCCTLFRLDVEASKVTGSELRVPGLKFKLHPYQMLGTFAMLENEVIQNGGYNADDMGLGKTVEGLAATATNRALVLNRREVADARKAERWDLHLRAGTRTDPQELGIECPTAKNRGIQCTCVDSGVSVRLLPSYGPTLFIVPPGLMGVWLDHAKKGLDMESTEFDWTLRVAHGDPKWSKEAARLSANDRTFVTMNDDASRFDPRNDGSNLLCFTAAGSMQGHIDKVMAIIIPAKPKEGKRHAVPKQYQHWTIGWGRIVVDEAHTESNKNTGALAKIRSIDNNMTGQKSRKTLLTGTPFEQSPRQMAGWVSLLQDPTWDQTRNIENSPRCTRQVANLKKCTEEKLNELGKRHEWLVKELVKGNEDKIKPDLKEHKRDLSTVVNTLWVRRTKNSLFFGFDLVLLKPSYHFDCLLPYEQRYKDVLKDRSRAAYDVARTTYNKQMVKFTAGQVIQKPVFSASQYLQAARGVRIISSFPELAFLPDTKTLSLTLQEIQQNGWIRAVPGKLYEMARVNSPYERNVKVLASPRNNPKMHAVQLVRHHIWSPNEKIVIMTMSPVSALILYWAIRLIWKKPVALITSFMTKSRVVDIIKLFQEGKDGSPSTSTDEVPQFLVGSSALLCKGITLTNAKRLILFDSEWLLSTELQCIGRVDRMGQTEETYTMKLVNEDCDVDMSIHDRQGARRHLLEAVEAPLKESDERELRSIDEEGAYDNEEFNENGKLVKNGNFIEDFA